tara:strand:+ start:1143 stop:1388 length:246 start_codon:yes stop_codon:yes gene_type:complete
MTIENEDILMEDCQTLDEYAQYFKTYNDENPVVYFKLALRKLPNLREDQTSRLNEKIENGNADWDSYCSILTMQQIDYVGW